MDPQVRDRLKAKFGDQSVRTGGRGTVRRKKKAVRKNTTQDDKRLQSTLKKLNVTSIPAIEEVNMFMKDGQVIHLENPKVQASIAANTYVVSGAAETKPLQDLLPGIITQLGADNVENLRRITQAYEQHQKQQGDAPSGVEAVEGDDDDDVPDLVENFEEAAAN